MNNARIAVGEGNPEEGKKQAAAKAGRGLFLAVVGIALVPGMDRTAVVQAADVMVNVSTQHQVIDGFGASSAWVTLNDPEVNTLYGDLGYSILRLRIDETIGDNGDNWKNGPYTAWATELGNAKKAYAKGAKVFASPWNPPKSLRLNGGGGQYSTDPSQWAGYRDYLNAYVKYMKDNGVNLYAISIQNEPDYAGSWTYWSATQDHDFVLNYGAGINTKLMAAESFNFNKSYYDQILNDPKALANVAILGTHLYGSFAGTDVKNLAYSLFESKGRPAGTHLWMTEHYFDTDNISDLVKMMQELHDCMVTGNMNGYVYWWINWTQNGLYTSGGGSIYKRAFILGQFAKYIRPGYYRVDATAAPATNVSVSAYAGADTVVIVAVNTGTNAVSQKFTLQNASVSQFSSWNSGANTNMAAGAAATVTGGSFTASLPAQSITTFVGKNTTASIESRAAASEFKTGLSNGNIVVTPLNSGKSYNVSVQMVNGRQVALKRGAQGVMEIPAGARGTYVVDIESEGRHQRQMVLSY